MGKGGVLVVLCLCEWMVCVWVAEREEEGHAAWLSHPHVSHMFPIPMLLQPGGKTAYHAAAVISSNYLIALQSVAVDLLADAGIDQLEGLDVLMPIIEGTVYSLKANRIPNVCGLRSAV